MHSMFGENRIVHHCHLLRILYIARKMLQQHSITQIGRVHSLPT
jgi:hypothetical protein